MTSTATPAPALRTFRVAWLTEQLLEAVTS
jgi:hypothetical protein